jgi:hypothetical protein
MLKFSPPPQKKNPLFSKNKSLFVKGKKRIYWGEGGRGDILFLDLESSNLINNNNNNNYSTNMC